MPNPVFNYYIYSNSLYIDYSVIPLKLTFLDFGIHSIKVTSQQGLNYNNAELTVQITVEMM